MEPWGDNAVVSGEVTSYTHSLKEYQGWLGVGRESRPLRVTMTWGGDPGRVGGAGWRAVLKQMRDIVIYEVRKAMGDPRVELVSTTFHKVSLSNFTVHADSMTATFIYPDQGV